VDIAIHEEYGSIGNESVEILSPRRPAWEGLHRPPPAKDPRLVGMRRRIGGDDLPIAVEVMGVLEIDPEANSAGLRRMAVRILKRGKHHPPGQRNDLGPRTSALIDDFVLSDAYDPTLANRDGGGRRTVGTARVHRASGEDEVSGRVQPRSLRLSTSSLRDPHSRSPTSEPEAPRAHPLSASACPTMLST
jgi:hypothetical protein